MLITHEREKLIEAIKYFHANTKYCGLIKLFKLLYFLDFTHFRQTSKPVTGLEYFALPRGPVPLALYEEIKDNGVIDNAIKIHSYSEIDTPAGKTFAPAKIEFKEPFNERFFTKRELRLMSELAFIFSEATAEQISEVSHLKDKPWHTTKQKHGLNQRIDYMLSMDGEDEFQLAAEILHERIKDREVMKRVFA